MRIGLGILLLTTATLKARDAFSFGGRVAGPFPPLVILLAVQVEAALGLWLLSGLAPSVARRVALCSFVLLAAVAAYLGLTGAPTCGCAGAVSVSPWIAFGVDVFAVALLLYCRASRFGFSIARKECAASIHTTSLRPLFASVGVTVIACLGVAYFALGPFSMAGAFLRGDRVIASPGVVELGPADEGAKLTATFRLTSLTDEPLAIVGAEARCGCTATRDLPLVLPPHGSRWCA